MKIIILIKKGEIPQKRGRAQKRSPWRISVGEVLAEVSGVLPFSEPSPGGRSLRGARASYIRPAAHPEAYKETTFAELTTSDTEPSREDIHTAGGNACRVEGARRVDEVGLRPAGEPGKLHNRLYYKIL